MENNSSPSEGGFSAEDITSPRIGFRYGRFGRDGGIVDTTGKSTVPLFVHHFRRTKETILFAFQRANLFSEHQGNDILSTQKENHHENSRI
jgi:hypothetical protein